MDTLYKARLSSNIQVDNDKLWKSIDEYQIDDPSSEFKFSDRLARENMWSKEYTMRVIEEYKKFMFLACVSVEPVTPSLEVDECWHLHMLYTRDYWYRFKLTALDSHEIHHGPTRGGQKEDAKFVDWYQRTKDKYEEYFHQKPPEDIWPSSKVRFRPVNFVRVDLMNHWVIPVGDWKAHVKAIFSHIKWKIKNLCGQLFQL